MDFSAILAAGWGQVKLGRSRLARQGKDRAWLSYFTIWGGMRTSDVLPPHEERLVPFFVLVLGLSIPFWILGAIVEGELLPGLPVSGLAFLIPVTAASILVYTRHRAAGVAALLGRSFDFKRITLPIWYIPIVLLIPALYALAYGFMQAVGRPVPEPHFNLVAIAALLAALFFGGLAEELGWSGYAIDPMQHRWGALRAALLLGAFWAVWHLVPLVQADRAPSWIAWWSVGTVSLRVLHVWLYNNTGRSVFGQALLHASSNLAWQLFPTAGSHYDPAFTGPLLFIAAVVVTLVWGPHSLARHRQVV